MATIAENLNAIKDAKLNIYTSILNKGQYPSGGLDTYAEAISKIEGGVINQDKTINVDKNGTQEVAADKGYTGLGKVVVNTNVPLKKVENRKSLNITNNGLQSINPSEGFDGIAGVDLNVDIPGTGDKFIKLYTGTVFTGSLWTIFPWTNADGSGLTSTNSMFSKCNKLNAAPLFDTQNVTDMSHMFEGCESLTTVPQFNTQNVKHMNNMFAGCYKLISVPEMDISSATDMEDMFAHCTSLTEVRFKGGHTGINCGDMFYGVSTTGKAYFKTEWVENYNDIIAALPKTWTYEYYNDPNEQGGSGEGFVPDTPD